MMEEMNEVHDFMSKFGKDVETKWGLYIDESLEEQVKFTVLATGFGIKDVPGMDNMMNKRTIEEQKKLEELEEEEQRKDERRGDYYGKDTFKNSNKMTLSVWWKRPLLSNVPKLCWKVSSLKQ